MFFLHKMFYCIFNPFISITPRKPLLVQLTLHNCEIYNLSKVNYDPSTSDLISCMVNIYPWPGEWGLTAKFFAHLPYTANSFGLMYSRKRISQNSFPNLIYIFPKSFMIFCQELHNPKRNYENQICTKAPKDVIMKKKIRHHTLDLNSVPLKHQQVF
jgi:hypothetical protein